MRDERLEFGNRHRDWRDRLAGFFRRGSAKFCEIPFAEAVIRANLGTIYWYLGEPSNTVRQCERAVELFKATVGSTWMLGVTV